MTLPPLEGIAQIVFYLVVLMLLVLACIIRALVDTAVPPLVPTGPWLSWQHDVISLPATADVLAHNLLGPQAFRVGRHLGVQFHPEATPETVAGWATTDADRREVEHLLSAVARDEAAAAASTWRLLAAFIDTV